MYDNTGFNAFGKPVPSHRLVQAEKHLKDMGITDAAVISCTINQMKEAIQRDSPMKAQQLAMNVLDLTGAYRLMAAMCSDV